MSASFQLSPEDFRSFQRIVGKRFAKQHGQFGIPFFLGVVAWFCVSMGLFAFLRIASYAPELTRMFGPLIGLFLAGFFLAVVAPHVAQRRFSARALHPRGAFLSPQSVQVSDESLVFISGAGRSEVPWRAVLAQAEDARNHYLFIDTMHAMAIPKAVVPELGPAFKRKLQGVGS